MNRGANARSIFDDSDDEELEALKPNKKWTKEEELVRQKREIEEMSEHMSVVSQISTAIYDQIIKSNRELEDLGQDLEGNMTRLDLVTNRTKKMVEKAGGPRYCCIIMTLSLSAFILFLLVLYV